MPRLLRFFLLTSTHLAAVCTVIICGVAQVNTPVANAKVGREAYGVAAHPQGFIVALQSHNNLRTGLLFLPLDDDPKWKTAFTSSAPRTRLLFNHIWIERSGSEVFVGIRFWAALLGLLVANLLVRYATRKSGLRRTLESFSGAN